MHVRKHLDEPWCEFHQVSFQSNITVSIQEVSSCAVASQIDFWCVMSINDQSMHNFLYKFFYLQGAYHLHFYSDYCFLQFYTEIKSQFCSFVSVILHQDMSVNICKK